MPDAESVILKGDRRGVVINLRDTINPESVIHELKRKLSAARNLLSGAPVRVVLGGRGLEPEECPKEFLEVLAEFDLKIMPPLSQAPTGRDSWSSSAETMKPYEPALLLKRTLRSGQRIDFDGNVVVVGDVNPGAVITCTGDIVVIGTLRGVAHAGAGGNTKAQVVAFRLEPTQLRIASVISRAPDGESPHPSAPEVALIKDGAIHIQTYAPK